MTAIRNIELSAPLAPIDDVAAYGRCMLVLRWHGRVVGREFVTVRDGGVSVEQVEELLAGSTGEVALFRWLFDALEYDDRATLDPAPASGTVAICTRERPHDLERALIAVSAVNGTDREILVVDNAPETEATRSVADRFPAARYIVEPRRGLNAARNRALREASHDVVAFTDDDAAPEPQWLDNLLRNFGDRRTVCATGLTLPLELETEAQELFEQHCTFVRGFERRVFEGSSGNPLAVGLVGAGANMAVRRDAILDLGGFDERLDAGMPTRSGGDHEMFVRILASGLRIAYDPVAVSWHRHRRTHDELLDTVYGYGVGVYATWTGLLVERQELGVLRMAWLWFRKGQLPLLLRRGAQRQPQARLTWTELRGCLHGPRAWLAARRLQSAGE